MGIWRGKGNMLVGEENIEKGQGGEHGKGIWGRRRIIWGRGIQERENIGNMGRVGNMGMGEGNMERGNTEMGEGNIEMGK